MIRGYDIDLSIDCCFFFLHANLPHQESMHHVQPHIWGYGMVTLGGTEFEACFNRLGDIISSAYAIEIKLAVY